MEPMYDTTRHLELYQQVRNVRGKFTPTVVFGDDEGVLAAVILTGGEGKDTGGQLIEVLTAWTVAADVTRVEIIGEMTVRNVNAPDTDPESAFDAVLIIRADDEAIETELFRFQIADDGTMHDPAPIDLENAAAITLLVPVTTVTVAQAIRETTATRVPIGTVVPKLAAAGYGVTLHRRAL